MAPAAEPGQGKGEVVRFRYGAEPVRLFEFSQNSATPTDLRSSYSGAANGHLIRAGMYWPFRWILQDTSGVIQGGSSAREAVPAPGENFATWVGLRVVALDRGFIQTLADPRSDSRAILLYDSAGHFIRQTRLGLSFGVLAAEPAQKQLVALRTTDRVDLVIYQWAWQPPSLNTLNKSRHYETDTKGCGVVWGVGRSGAIDAVDGARGMVYIL